MQGLGQLVRWVGDAVHIGATLPGLTQVHHITGHNRVDLSQPLALPTGSRGGAKVQGSHQTHALVCIHAGSGTLADVLLTVGMRHANVLLEWGST
jgi:hypothetical protein